MVVPEDSFKGGVGDFNAIDFPDTLLGFSVQSEVFDVHHDQSTSSAGPIEVSNGPRWAMGRER